MTHAPLYAALALGIVMLLTATAFTFLRPTSGSFATWENSGAFAPGERAVLPTAAELGFGGEGRNVLATVPLPQREDTEQAGSFAGELADILALLVQSHEPREDRDPDVPDAYAFIPQGLTTIETAPPRTPVQQALHEYGNVVGGSLLSFADSHSNMPQVLKNQAEDRTDPLKVSALKRLADDFVHLSEELALLEPVPSEAASAHSALVAAYRDVGEALVRVPDAHNDQTFLDAVYAYNTTAENLSKRLVALVDLFASHEVRFSQSDSGRIFMFSASPSF